MNIFVLDENPTKCAKAHKDKHVVKMPLETAQLLCGVQHFHDRQPPYKLTHKNHPCAIWARECRENYDWLCRLGIALCKEYTRRYGRRHASQDVIEWCISSKIRMKRNGSKTPYALAMPEECKLPSATESYKLYYLRHKSHLQ